MINNLKIWLAGAVSIFIGTLFAMFKHQKNRANTLERAVEALEEENKIKESASTAKEEVLSEGLRRRSQVYKELEQAKDTAKDIPYPEGKLDPEFIELLNTRSNLERK